VRAVVVTPAEPGSLSGNRVTAERWARLLEELGHDVAVQTEWDGAPADLLIALHARKSHASILRFDEGLPEAPIVVALTGTDLYVDLHDRVEVLDSLRRAQRLVALQGLAARKLPAELRERVRVIYQSAESLIHHPRAVKDSFDVCLLAHLRSVKDPLLAARAARQLPADSRVRVLHAGEGLDPELVSAAKHETDTNSRYQWLGPLAPAEARQLLVSSRLLVVCSRSEGGANVVSEAIACGVPILSTRIDGSVGLLDEDYPGFFEVGDASGLASQLRRAEKDEGFLCDLRKRCEQFAPSFTGMAERNAWSGLLRELGLG
jgi:putative glycosyltransferase (TIGR04348 family)